MILYPKRSIFATHFLKINYSGFMIIIDVKDNETIDRALRRYKRKYITTGTLKELRQRKHFTKPSVKRRNEILKATYKQKKFAVE